MVATLLVTLFAGAALLALGAMIDAWHRFGFRFRELREELCAAEGPVTVRYVRRDTAARPSAVIYALDFKAKADGLPFHPEAGRAPAPALLAAA